MKSWVQKLPRAELEESGTIINIFLKKAFPVFTYGSMYNAVFESDCSKNLFPS